MVHHVTQNILFHTFHHVINDDGRVVLRLQDGLFSLEDTQAVIDKIKSIANHIIYTDPPLHLYATDLPNYTSINGVPLKNWSLQGKYIDVFPTVPDTFRMRSNNNNPYMFPVTHADESYYSLVSDGFVPGGLENPDIFLKNFFKSSTNSFLCLAKMRHFTSELSSAILDNMNIRHGVKHSGISVGSVIDKDEELFFRQADQFLRAYQYASST